MEKPVVGSDCLNLFQHYPLQFHCRNTRQKERRGQGRRSSSSIPCQLPPSPMPVFPVGLEHPLDVPIERPEGGWIFDASYLRLAEKSVAQLILQSCDWRRSAAIHTVKLIKTITVTPSLARMLSFTNPAPAEMAAHFALHGTKKTPRAARCDNVRSFRSSQA
jgi:hypothetical protein